MNAQIRGLAWAAIALGLGIGGAWGLPRAVTHVPMRLENALASMVGILPDSMACAGLAHADARTALESLIKRLYPLYPDDATLPVEIRIIPGDTVNAFAGLAGHIYVFAGLLQAATSPEELAGVLAHEIEHVRRRHVLQGTFLNLLTRAILGGLADSPDAAGGQVAGLFLQLQFSRDQEAQADAGAIERLQMAHIDPAGLARFFEREEQSQGELPAFFSSHPSHHTRANLIRHSESRPSLPLLNAQQWHALQTMCQP